MNKRKRKKLEKKFWVYYSIRKLCKDIDMHDGFRKSPPFLQIIEGICGETILSEENSE